MLKPVANAYANATGHRQMGLRYDDLMVEESPRVQKALSRLPEKEAYDRAYRLRQAAQLSVLHRELPKEQWLPAKEVSFTRTQRVVWHNVRIGECATDSASIARNIIGTKRFCLGRT